MTGCCRRWWPITFTTNALQNALRTHRGSSSIRSWITFILVYVLQCSVPLTVIAQLLLRIYSLSRVEIKTACWSIEHTRRIHLSDFFCLLTRLFWRQFYHRAYVCDSLLSAKLIMQKPAYCIRVSASILLNASEYAENSLKTSKIKYQVQQQQCESGPLIVPHRLLIIIQLEAKMCTTYFFSKKLKSATTEHKTKFINSHWITS